MQAIISIAAMAMAFACVSAHELRGGLVVSPWPTFSLVFTKQTLTPFLSPTSLASYSWRPSLPLTSSLSAPQVLSDVTTTDVGREIHGKSRGESLKWYPSTKLIADIDPCDTFAVKFSDCLQSEGESVIEVVACFDCLSHAWVSKLEDGYTCADLKEIGYCDAIEDCAVGACNNQCSAELNDVEECIITYDRCNNEDYYRDECIDGI